MNKLHKNLLTELDSVGEEHVDNLIEVLVSKGDGDHKHELEYGWLEYQVGNGVIFFAEYFYNVESEFRLEEGGE